MTFDVKDQIRQYAEHADSLVSTLTVDEIVASARQRGVVVQPLRRWSPVWVVVVAFLAVLLAVGVVALLPRADRPEVADGPTPQPSIPVTPSETGVEPGDADEPAAPTTATTTPTTTATTVTSSSTGYTWTQLTLPQDEFSQRGELWGVTHTGSRFVVVGRIDSDCAQVWVSADGSLWGGAPVEGGGVSLTCRAVLNDAASRRGVTVAVGEKDGLPAIWVSDDGHGWDLFGHVEPPFIEGDEIRSVAGSELGFVAAGSSLWFSPDGRTWTEATVPLLEWIADVTGGPGGFIAVGRLPTPVSVAGRQWASANAVLHSADGQTWTVVAELEGAFQEGTECWVAANAVGYGPGGYVVVGDCTSLSASEPSEEATHVYSSMWTSADGLTWTQVPHDPAAFGEPAYISSITADEMGYLAAGWLLGETGSNAAVWSSGDGTSWTRTELPGDGTQAYAVALHEGTAVAVGQSGSDPTIWLAIRR